MKQYLLFDLDGTLTDPKIGITTCVQYALHSMGIEEPDLDKLEPFIGPPLQESFQEFYHMTENQAEQAVKKYRERFQETGIFENSIYKGIPQMLRTLQSKGIFLAVASSKPTVYVQRILEHFEIASYFKVVVGSELDGSRTKKEEVIQEALQQLFGEKPIQLEKVYMIGDRKFDIEGAKAIGIESVGVSYGYGSIEELKKAKASYIVQSVEELQKFLLRGAEEAAGTNQKKKGLFPYVWAMLFPFLVFMMVRIITLQVLSMVIFAIGSNATGGLAEFLVIKDETQTPIELTDNAITIMSALGFVAGALAIFKKAKAYIQKGAEEMKLAHLKKEPAKNYVLLFFVTIGAVFGFNLLIELLQLTEQSQAYQQVAENQFSASLWVGLLCYGVISPIAEELLFRGIIYNVLKRMTKLPLAMIVSAFLFGSYHMNSVQGAYGFAIGCLMVYAYEYFGTFYAPVAIHILSNILAIVMEKIVMISAGFVNWITCIIFLAIAAGGLYLLRKQKKVFYFVRDIKALMPKI